MMMIGLPHSTLLQGTRSLGLGGLWVAVLRDVVCYEGRGQPVLVPHLLCPLHCPTSLLTHCSLASVSEAALLPFLVEKGNLRD